MSKPLFQEGTAVERAVAPAKHDPLAAAQAVLLAGLQADQPAFMRDRYARLAAILEMLEDPHWPLSPADQYRIMNVLACFMNPVAAPTDHLILIELASRELQHDLDAYHAFRRVRRRAAQRHSPHDADREHWLAQQREALQLRMRQRRERDQYSEAGAWRRWWSLLNL